MTRTRAILGALVLSFCLAPTAVAKIYVRWSYREVPAVKTLGVDTLVLPWNEEAKPVLAAALARGYRVYLETSPDNAAAIAESAVKNGVDGMILEPEAAKQADAEAIAQTLRTHYPRLKILVLSPGGRQPDMRGWLVFNKNGILQVSSPTSQPWLDSNLTLVRYQQTYERSQAPLYTFSWDLSNALTKDRGPHPEDYALAIAEAGAFDADLILEIHDRQQKGLVHGDQETLTDWSVVKRALTFYREHPFEPRPAACVAVLSEDYESTFEAMNLMARHNIPYRVLRPSDVKPADFAAFDVVIAFTELGNALTEAVSRFAEVGGVAVLVNLKGPLPWESDATAKTKGPSTTYSIGKGRIIELHEPVVDPETFARDVRQLMAKDRIPVALWNSLTTLVVAYPDQKSGDVTVELVNYAQESTQVQVRVKGNFSSVEFQTPEHSSWETVKPSIVDGFTEFVVPGIIIGGRVRLSNAASPAR